MAIQNSQAATVLSGRQAKKGPARGTSPAAAQLSRTKGFEALVAGDAARRGKKTAGHTHADRLSARPEAGSEKAAAERSALMPGRRPSLRQTPAPVKAVSPERERRPRARGKPAERAGTDGKPGVSAVPCRDGSESRPRRADTVAPQAGGLPESAGRPGRERGPAPAGSMTRKAASPVAAERREAAPAEKREAAVAAGRRELLESKRESGRQTGPGRVGAPGRAGDTAPAKSVPEAAADGRTERSGQARAGHRAPRAEPASTLHARQAAGLKGATGTVARPQAAAQGEAPRQATGTWTVTAREFASEISMRISMMLRENARSDVVRARIFLEPEALGEVEVDLEIGAGLKVKLTAHQETGFAAIRQELGQLRTALEARGLSLDDLSLDLAPGDTGDGPATGRDNTGHEKPRAVVRAAMERLAPAMSEVSLALDGGGTLNMIV